MFTIDFRPRAALLYSSIWMVLVFIIAPAGDAYSQPEERLTDFSRPGRPTMLVYVWGTASISGIWKVEQGVDLIQLLSAAQIPNIGAVEQTSKQTVYLRIYRPSGGRRVEIYDSEIKKMIAQGSNYPSLQDGDILFLETVTKNRFNLQTIFSAIGAAASLTLLIIRVNQL